MIQRSEVYRCGVCGNIVEVLHAGGGILVCCGEPMKVQNENTVDASKEKHVPVIERSAAGVTVKVGGVPHPMEEKHWIQWIELIAGERVYRRYLKPGDKPEATFPPVEADAALVAREYCNLHGHWKAS